MAVTLVEAVPAEAQMRWTAEERSYTYKYLVRTNSASDDLATVAGAAGIPELFSVHANDAFAYVKEKTATLSAQLLGGVYSWVVLVHYSTSMGQVAQELAGGGFGSPGGVGTGGGGTEPPATPAEIDLDSYADPVNRVPVWSVQVQTELQAVEQDANGDAIVNSAGAPYLPPLETDVPRCVFTVTVNKAGVLLDELLDLVGDVNGDEWTPAGQGATFAARTVKVLGVNATPRVENNVSYVEVQWTLEYRTSWTREVLDQGYHWYDPETEQLVRFTDGSGQPLAHPVPLDGEGLRLSQEQIESGEFVYLDYDLEPATSFTGVIP